MTEEVAQDPAEGTVEDAVATETWVDRLIAESTEIVTRLAKLRAFMQTDGYATLPWQDRDALDRQMQHMAAYAGVLDERLARIPAVNDDPANPEIDGPAADAVDNDAEA